MTKFQKLLMVFGFVGMGVATGCATVGVRDDTAGTDPTPLTPGDIVEDTQETAEVSETDEPQSSAMEADAIDQSGEDAEDVAVEEDADTDGEAEVAMAPADEGLDEAIDEAQAESGELDEALADAEDIDDTDAAVDDQDIASIDEDIVEEDVAEVVEPDTDDGSSGGLRTNQAGVDVIKAYEGLRLEAYVGPDGGTYIGYGHAEDVYMGMTITEETAEALLKQDLVEIEDAIKALVTVPINDNELSGMVSLAYNIGIFAFTDSTVLRQLNDGDRVAAGDAFMMWNKINEGGGLVENEQLTERRQTERALFLTPPGEETVVPISALSLKDRELSQR